MSIIEAKHRVTGYLLNCRIYQYRYNNTVLMYHIGSCIIIMTFFASKGCFVTRYKRIKVCVYYKGVAPGYLDNRNTVYSRARDR